MWVYDGKCALGDSWVEDFMESLEEITENARGGKHFDPYDCFIDALNQWSDRMFIYYGDQDEFVSEVGLDDCIRLIGESGMSSMKDVDSGIQFCTFACESAFNQCITWEDDEENNSVKESIRSRRARKSMLESRRSANRRGRARRIR